MGAQEISYCPEWICSVCIKQKYITEHNSTSVVKTSIKASESKAVDKHSKFNLFNRLYY